MKDSSFILIARNTDAEGFVEDTSAFPTEQLATYVAD